MKSRNWFPLDLAALLFSPLIIGSIALLSGSLFPVLNWIHHPTTLGWLWAFFIATTTAVVGCILLFLAKIPQYREGIFLRIGSGQLPPREQRLYRVAFWLIVPSIVALLVLISSARHFQ